MPIYMGIFDKPNVLSKDFKGEVKAAGYEGWIELQSAQVGMSRPIGATDGRSTDRENAAPTLHEIVVSKHMDSSSTALFKEAVSGKGRLIVIAFVKGDGTAYLKVVLQSAMISSYTISGDPPIEQYSLNFTKITYEAAEKSPNTTHAQMHQLSQQGSWDSYP